MTPWSAAPGRRRGARKTRDTSALIAACVLATCGCSRNTPPPQSEADAPTQKMVRVAQPCPELARLSGPLDPSDVRAFIEVAQLAGDNPPLPLGSWLDTEPVLVRSTAHVVAFPDIPMSTPWGLCVDEVCSSGRRSLTVTARLPHDAAEPLHVSLRIEESAAPAGAAQNAGSKMLLDATLDARDREPVLLASPPELGEGSILVTAYLLRRFDDLHRVLECKAERRGTGAPPGSPE